MKRSNRVFARDRIEKTDHGARYLPTPKEIAKAAEAIREGWTDGEREKRCQLPQSEPVELKMFAHADLRELLLGSYD
jgi:hypothetical protein